MRERGIHHNDAADGDGLERPTVVDVADAALQGGEAVARLDAPPRLGAEDGEFGQDARALLRRARPDIRVFTSSQKLAQIFGFGRATPGSSLLGGGRCGPSYIPRE